MKYIVRTRVIGEPVYETKNDPRYLSCAGNNMHEIFRAPLSSATIFRSTREAKDTITYYSNFGAGTQYTVLPITEKELFEIKLRGL